MSKRNLLARRRFIRQLTVLAGAIALPLPRLADARSPARHGHSPFAPALGELLLHTDSATVIGETYLRHCADERSSAALESKLLASLPAGCRIDGCELGKQVRRDFTTGNVVDLDGWRLSRTEARLCALYACRARGA